MHIALVTTYPPGKGTLNEYAFHFVRGLRNKHDLSQITLLVDELPDAAAYPEPAPAPGLAPMRIVPCWRFGDSRNAQRILAATKAANPDGVLFNLQFATFGGTKIPATLGLSAPKLVRMAGFPTMVLLHNIMETVDLRNAGYAGNPVMEAIMRTAGNLITRLILSVDKVALTIPKYVEILTAKYHATNVLLAPHGSFEERLDMPSLDLPPGLRQIMTFGKFGTYKKVEMMFDAYQLLLERGYSDLEIVIAGSDSPNAAGYLDAMRTKYTHLPNVRFTGYVAETDVPRIFGDSAVVIFPYTSTTGSSGVLHQAGAYGKAVVLPNIGDFAEVITEEGYDGEFFLPDDIPTLADAIARILDNDEHRRELGARNFLASQGLPLNDVVDWYLLHMETILPTKRFRGPVTEPAAKTGAQATPSAPLTR